MSKNNSCLVEHFQRLADAGQPDMSWRAANADEHRRWRAGFRRTLGGLVGRRPAAVPPRVRVAETVTTPAFTRRKIYIRTEAHYEAPAYLFIPRRLEAPAPALVCLHGHSGIRPYIREGTPAEKEKSRAHELDFAPYFAEHGYVTLAPVQRGWNETAAAVAKPETGCQRMVLNAFLMGMTPLGLRCWDASRALDYLAGRPEVDRRRIGVAGLSGGGMVALFWAALEPRVRLAMVAGYYCTFRDSIYAIRHCLCNCVPGIMPRGEMRDVAALIAPRPLLVISGIHDRIFPIAATRAAYADLEPVYRLLGAPDNLESDFFDGPHAWSNRRTLPFLARHFGPGRRAGEGGSP